MWRFSMRLSTGKMLAAVAIFGLAHPASADVITDWNENAVSFGVLHNIGPPPAERIIAMTQVAMFDAVNSIERKYRPYLIQLPVPPTASKDAAAAAAAGTVLAGINPQTQATMKSLLESYLAAIPDSPAKAEGIRLGEAVAAKILEERANDGARAPDTYRPRATAGIYVPTAPTAASQWPKVKPFALTSASQFRPAPPIALESAEWAADYNEIKELGGRASTKRSARQTEDARFWLVTDGRGYYPVIRTLVEAKKLSLVDSARLFALAAVAREDALIAVFDAKYHYEFWRPVTASRIGVMEVVFGTAEMPEVSIASPTAPGVVHRWTNVRAFSDEVSQARIWAGFHYRSSTKVGQDMGHKIGDYVAKNLMQPVAVVAR